MFDIFSISCWGWGVTLKFPIVLHKLTTLNMIMILHVLIKSGPFQQKLLCALKPLHILNSKTHTQLKLVVGWFFTWFVYADG